MIAMLMTLTSREIFLTYLIEEFGFRYSVKIFRIVLVSILVKAA